MYIIPYYIVQNREDEVLGFIERRRMGRFMHWCLASKVAMYSNGCLKQITSFITKLYGKERR